MVVKESKEMLACVLWFLGEPVCLVGYTGLMSSRVVSSFVLGISWGQETMFYINDVNV